MPVTNILRSSAPASYITRAVEAIFFLPSLPSWGHLFDAAAEPNAEVQLGFTFAAGYPQFMFVQNDAAGNAIFYQTSPPNAVSASVWHHIVMSVSCEGAACTPSVYLDGQAVSISTAPWLGGYWSPSTAGPVDMPRSSNFIGKANNGDPNWMAGGSIAELAIYNQALSAQQVGAHYQAVAFPPPPPPPPSPPPPPPPPLPPPSPPPTNGGEVAALQALRAQWCGHTPFQP